ncbi:Ig-like domain repeat protein [Streptomyces sp. NBC_01190]|uniref:Ig-like domain repeat protein n=1 Tax=Streptomyces sp. NBC_01190 TaxID=2903767 RepID=UPI00386E944E|nr:Ig-like domain repeat protein [Streptomyces sp. NBC_01190]
MRFSRTSALTALAVLAGIAQGVGSAGTAWADAPHQLDLPGYSHLVVDASHGHVFVSGGPDSTDIAVADLDGAQVGTVDDESGATSMALSPDGGTLYVALPGSDAVSAVDTATLTETARYSTGSGPQDDPHYLAYAGGLLWFGYGSQGQGGIGSIDVEGPRPTVSLDGGLWYAAPLLASDPAVPGTLVAGEVDTSRATLKVYDVSSGVPVTTASQADGGPGLEDLAITPDGKDVVVAAHAPYHQVFKLTDLSPDGQLATAYSASSVAVAPDGTIAAGVSYATPDLFVFRPGTTTPLHSFDVSSDDGYLTLPDAGLAWDPDGSRLFGVTDDAYNGVVELHVVPEPLKAASRLTVHGPEYGFGYPYLPLTLTGQLTSDDPYAAGQVLHVTRTDPAGPDGVPLADVAVAADGSFEVTDTPTVSGDHTYTVTYAGDSGHAEDTERVLIPVGKAPAQVPLDGPADAPRGSVVTITGSLTSSPDAPFAPGQSVKISRVDASGTTSLPDVRAAADGTFSFADTPQIGGINNYKAAYAGDVSHVAAVSNHEVDVSRSATTVTVTTNATHYPNGATAKITAHLGTTYNGRTLSVYAQPDGGMKTLLKTATVDAHGNLAVGYRVTGRTEISAEFTGDYRYGPATAATTIW